MVGLSLRAFDGLLFVEVYFEKMYFTWMLHKAREVERDTAPEE